MLRASIIRVALPCLLELVFASHARAQGTAPLRLAEILPDLILRGITLPRPSTPEISHEAHFSPIDANELNNPAVGIVQSFNKLMMMQLSTFPLGSSAGAFTYTFDESLGTFRRASRSFGPSFAERAMTSGRGKIGGGVTYQRTRYRSFEGESLDDGSIKFYLRHSECCSPGTGGGGGGGGGGGAAGGGPVAVPNGTRLSPPFEGDLIEAALSLDASSDTVAFFASYGLTNRWDVGVLVPVVRVELDASVRATILRLATQSTPLTHTFEQGNPLATEKTFRQSASASGLGDNVLRSKYRFIDFAGGGLAGAVDLRLPTGSKEDLLGSGTQTKIFLVASAGTDRVVEHINFGYTVANGDVGQLGLLAAVGGDQPLPDQVNYAGGVEVIAHPRLTIIGDIVGRTLRDAGRLTLTTKSLDYQGLTGVQTTQFDEFEPQAGDLNLVLGTVGFKFNPIGDWLLSSSVLFPLTDAGLRSFPTLVVGLDYAF